MNAAPMIPFSQADFMSMLPVWALTITGCVLMLVNMTPRRPGSNVSALVTLIGLAVSAWGLWTHRGDTRALFNEMYVVDAFSTFFALLFVAIAGVSVLLSWDYLKRTALEHGEYYALIAFATLGMIFMAAANDLMMIFLGLELMSIPLYILAAFRKNRFESNEAGLKYFLLGAFASGFLLYGIALIYGTTGSTNLTRIGAFLLGSPVTETPLFIIGSLLLLVGFAFKVSLVPFHMWTPDAYEGAPTTATAFMSAGAKAAGFAGLLRVGMGALPGVMPDWVGLLTVLAILTMTIGNVTAILQSNLKRMLAYSSIGHAGYVLLGVIAGGSDGYSAVLFYLAVYSVMNLGAFGIVSLMGRGTDERVRVQDMAGVGFRRPWMGAAMAVFMLGLAGIPPTAGFIGKFYLFRSALAEGHLMLVIVAVLNSVIAVYYYLRPVVVMYMTQPEGESLEISPAIPATIALVSLVVLTFALGVAPTALAEAALHSVLAVFH